VHGETLDVLCHLLLSGGNEFFQGVQILLYMGRMTCLSKNLANTELHCLI